MVCWDLCAGKATLLGIAAPRDGAVSKQGKLYIFHICRSAMPVRPDEILNAPLKEVFLNAALVIPLVLHGSLAGDAISERSVSTVSRCCS